MPSVVSTSSATATSAFFPLFQPSQAGKAATVKPSQKTPYDRSSSVSKKKEEDEDLSLHLSILHRPPPSFPLKVDERSSYLRPEIGDGKSKGKVTAFQWKVRRFYAFFSFISLLTSSSSLPSLLLAPINRSSTTCS